MAQEQLAESLSAFVDGECHELERRRVSEQLLVDDDTSSRWRRYHHARALMRREFIALPNDMVDRIASALAEEPELEVTKDGAAKADDAPPSIARRSVWRRALIPASAAAGFGLVMLLGIQLDSDDVPAPVAVAAQESMPVDPAAVEATLTASRMIVGEEREQRTRAYMLLHAQQTGLNQTARSMPFVRMVTFESQLRE